MCKNFQVPYGMHLPHLPHLSTDKKKLKKKTTYYPHLQRFTQFIMPTTYAWSGWVIFVVLAFPMFLSLCFCFLRIYLKPSVIEQRSDYWWDGGFFCRSAVDAQLLSMIPSRLREEIYQTDRCVHDYTTVMVIHGGSRKQG